MRPGLKGQSINVGEGEASLLTVVPAAPKALKTKWEDLEDDQAQWEQAQC